MSAPFAVDHYTADDDGLTLASVSGCPDRNAQLAAIDGLTRRWRDAGLSVEWQARGIITARHQLGALVALARARTVAVEKHAARPDDPEVARHYREHRPAATMRGRTYTKEQR